MTEPFYGRLYGNKVRPRWWSLLNWLKGYKFGPIQRHRCCDHTTPSHGWSCPKHPARLATERDS